MTAGWVAGSVRAQALARRRLGAAGARALAGSPDLATAVDTLAASPYGHDVASGQALTRAQHGVAASLLWNLRVLAGWLPAEGVETLRLLAGWFEVANVEERLRSFAGSPADPEFRPGTLATAWSRLAAAASPAALRAGLAASAWGDPGGDSPGEISLGMRLSWATRVARVPQARQWATGAVALLLAREVVLGRRALPAPAAAAATRLLGPGWSTAVTLEQLTERLPAAARWAVRGIGEPADLWRAEAGWWGRIGSDATSMLSRSGFGAHRVIGAVALLGVDAWRVRAALELAARAGRPLEVFDAVA